jgi:hypothetical protein
MRRNELIVSIEFRISDEGLDAMRIKEN